MEYTIGQFSKLIGLSSETLRHYERSGVFGSRRDPQNRYRVYSIEDILPILSVRQQRSVGMSLSDIEAVLKGMTLEQQLAWVEDKERSIDAEIERLQRMKENFHRFYQRLERSQKIQAENPGIVHETLPNAYQMILAYTGGYRPHYPAALLKKWIDEIYFTHILVFIAHPMVPGDGPLDIGVGLGVLERVQNTIQLPINQNVVRLPGGPGIAMTIKTTDPFSLKSSDFALIYAYRQQRGLSCDCALSASVDNVTYENGECQYYMTFRTLNK